MLKVNAEVVNAHALLQTGNVIRMFVGIAGSGEHMTNFLHFLFFGEKFLCITLVLGLNNDAFYYQCALDSSYLFVFMFSKL